MEHKNKRAAEAYRRGNEAVQKQNWELAVAMFTVCVKFVPDNLMYRQLLRNSTKKKYNDNGKGAGTLASMKLMGIRGKIKKARAKEEWEEVSQFAEEGLLINPWDAQLNIELAESCRHLDRGEIARFAYMEACKASPKDKSVFIAFAMLLEERGEYQEGVKALWAAQKIDPDDPTIKKMITDMQFKETTHRGGYEDASDTKDVMRDKTAASRQGQSAAPGEDQEADLRHAIRKDPESVENYLKLADFLKRTKKLSDARDALQKALEVSGGDPNILEQQEDIELTILQNNADIAREKANEAGSDEARKKAAELANELRARRIEVLTARVSRYPANMGIKLELAQLQMQLQNWSAAIPLLQKAGTDPRLKTKALVSLGKCFVYDKKLPLAKAQFERAIPDLNIDTDPDLYKDAHYLLARVAEETGDRALAEKHYGEVVVVDYDYKDAVKRMESLQSG